MNSEIGSKLVEELYEKTLSSIIIRNGSIETESETI